MKLGKERNEMGRAVFAEELHSLRSGGEDFWIGIVETGGDVGKLELDMFRVSFSPVGVSTDDEDSGITNSRVLREFWENLHDFRNDLVVVDIDCCTHRPHREERCLHVLPSNGISSCDSSSDGVERLLQTRSSSENCTAVLEGVSDLVSEISEGVPLFSLQRGRVVRVVKVNDDDTNQVDEDLEKGSDRWISLHLAESSRQSVPEVESDSNDFEFFVIGATLDELNEREESFGMLRNERLVPFSRFDEDSTEASHLVLLFPNLGIGENWLKSV